MSYATVQEAQTYLTARGLDAAGVADEQLLRGADYINQVYGGRFVGVPVTPGTAWPRNDATDNYGNDVSGTVPEAVKNASIEAAYRIANDGEADNVLLPDYTASEAVKRETVGPITTEYAVSVSAPQSNGGNLTPNSPTIPAIDAMLDYLLLRPFPLIGVV